MFRFFGYLVNVDDRSACSHYTEVSDGKGGKIRVKKPKASKGGKGGKAAKEKKWFDDVAQFSDATTDSEAVDLDAMAPEERERYLAERAKRREQRDKKRREKYGDKYDEMFAANAAWVSVCCAILVQLWLPFELL